MTLVQATPSNDLVLCILIACPHLSSGTQPPRGSTCLCSQNFGAGSLPSEARLRQHMLSQHGIKPSVATPRSSACAALCAPVRSSPVEPSPLHLAGAAEDEGSRFHVLVPRLLFMLLETKGSISMHQSYRNLDTKADGEFVSGPDGLFSQCSIF